MKHEQYLRLVELDDNSKVKEVIWESDLIHDDYELIKVHYDALLKWDEVYDFNDWDNVPELEFQIRESNSDEWAYYSEPVEDYMGL